MAKARVDDIEILKTFRAALFKFAENSAVALGDAESEVHRTLTWLDGEQLQKWNGELRKRQSALSQANEQLRMKKIFKGAAGSKQSYVDEEKLVQRCQKLVVEAQQKIVAVKSYSRRLQKEMLMYKGQVQRFATSTTIDIPLAGATLGNMIVRLEAYASLAPANSVSSAESAASTAGSAAQGGGMGRPEGQIPDDVGAVLQALRANTPSKEDRAAAPAGPVQFAVSATDQISDSDRETLSGMASGGPMDGELKIVVSGSIAGKKRLYLERLEPAAAGDSGWYVGPAEVGLPLSVSSVTVNEALAARPDWKELLALPVGSLVIVEGSVVGAILDTKGEELWTAASMAKLMEGSEAAAGSTADSSDGSSGASTGAPDNETVAESASQEPASQSPTS